jgi:hypothetical protein
MMGTSRTRVYIIAARSILTVVAVMPSFIVTLLNPELYQNAGIVATKSPQVVSLVKMKWIFNVSETITVSIIRDLCSA